MHLDTKTNLVKVLYNCAESHFVFLWPISMCYITLSMMYK